MVMNRRRGGGNMGVLLLGAQLMNFGLQYIPPATLALIAGQSAIFLDLLPQFFRSANSVCISSYLVYHHQDWRRLILAQFFHGDDMHLYFNMVSLLYKGSLLERKFGTPYFVYLTAVFTVLTGITYVGLGAVLSEVLGNQSYLMSCAVGFSGVLFAMKVLTTHYSPSGRHYALGFIPIPSKYIFWAELVLIQIVAPNSSFVGHLAGILVGLAYVKGPLKFFMDIFLSPEHSQGRRRRRSSSSSDDDSEGSSFFSSFFSRRGHGHRTGSSRSRSPRFHQGGYYGNAPGGWAPQGMGAPYHGYGRATPSAPAMDPNDIGFEAHNNNNGFVPPQNPAYDRFTGGYDEDEQYRHAMEESLIYSQPDRRQPGLYPDLDDLRSRRANFYQ
ncbi:rhomboid-related protein [Elysia marginata]|uniref:Rhomboid-related protein n=1 Tax=Elysia marginata TaxID=1093978 RepID=A0AAV4H3X7_9GAST|nr:rhomboid-related protein [Elysia marginata]